jgi:hypothetical protein
MERLHPAMSEVTRMSQVVLALEFVPSQKVITFRMTLGKPCVVPLPVPLVPPDGEPYTAISIVVEPMAVPDMADV